MSGGNPRARALAVWAVLAAYAMAGLAVYDWWLS